MSLFRFFSFFLSKILWQFFRLTTNNCFFGFQSNFKVAKYMKGYSMSLSCTLTFMSKIKEMTVSFRFLLTMDSDIPMMTMLFLLPWWAKEFCCNSRLTICCSRFKHFFASSDFRQEGDWWRLIPRLWDQHCWYWRYQQFSAVISPDYLELQQSCERFSIDHYNHVFIN